MGWDPAKVVKGETSHPGKKLLKPRTAFKAPALHVTASHNNLAPLPVKRKHAVDLAEIVRQICHHHQNRAVFNLVEAGQDGANHPFADVVFDQANSIFTLGDHLLD